jgi:hypothetical protein
MYYDDENNDADDYDEIYEDFDESFPDEEEDEGDVDIEYSPVLPKGRINELLNDPFPYLGIPLTIIGLLIVLLTPIGIWEIFRYMIAGEYLLLVLAAVASYFALRVWYARRTGWLRFGGPTNILVIWATFAISTADLLSWMISGVSIFGLTEPLVTTGLIIILFCFYSLWLIQRSIERE